jgi:hypothetical protein
MQSADVLLACLRIIVTNIQGGPLLLADPNPRDL